MLIFIIITSAFIIMLFLLNRTQKENVPPGKKIISVDLTPYTYVSSFEVSGVHNIHNWVYIIQFLKPRQPVRVFNEKNNRYSSKALAIADGNYVFGYIHKYDVDEVNELIKGEHLVLIKEISEINGWKEAWINIYHN